MRPVEESYWFAEKAEAGIAEAHRALVAGEHKRALWEGRTALIDASFAFEVAKMALAGALVTQKRVKGGVTPEVRRAYWMLMAARATSRLADPTQLDKLEVALKTALPRVEYLGEAVTMLRRCRRVDADARKQLARVQGFHVEEDAA